MYFAISQIPQKERFLRNLCSGENAICEKQLVEKHSTHPLATVWWRGDNNAVFGNIITKKHMKHYFCHIVKTRAEGLAASPHGPHSGPQPSREGGVKSQRNPAIASQS